MVDVTAIAAPALLAGGIAIGATMAIERFGGVAGGLLATLPTTVVPASWAFYGVTDGQALHDALSAVPVGMLVNAGFLSVWRWLPPRLGDGSLVQRLGQMVVASLAVWTVLAAVVVSGLGALRGLGIDVAWVGVAALTTTVIVGGRAVRAQAGGARATRKVPVASLLARGVLAALSILAAGALAGVGGELVASMASVFPSIFLTAMVSLWWSQGDAVPAGAVGPMMLGSASVGAYALVAAVLFPVLGPWLGAALAWAVAVGGVTVPAWFWARRAAGVQKA